MQYPEQCQEIAAVSVLEKDSLFRSQMPKAALA